MNPPICHLSMDEEIETVAILPTKRRKTDVKIKYQLCVICQSAASKAPLVCASSPGIQRIKEACTVRQKYVQHDTMFGWAVEQLGPSMSSLDCSSPKWHKSCYSSFTSKTNLERLTDRAVGGQNVVSHPDTPDPELPKTRQAIRLVDWEKCIFCQTRKREAVHQVQTLELNKVIHDLAKRNETLKCRIGENDLVAFEAHYHKSCRVREHRAILKNTDDASDVGEKDKSPFEQLVEIIEKGFQRGSVYSMDDICSKYSELLESSGMEKCSTRSHHIKEKLNNYFGNDICFRRQRSMNQPLLVFRSVSSGEAVEALKNVTESLQDSELTDVSTLGGSDTQTPSVVQSLHHVASAIHADLKSTPGHEGYGDLTKEAAERCVPDSLYMLMKWMFKPSEDPSSPEEDDAKNDSLHQTILHVCQNIVYAASHGRKNTPKHIGTGLLVHHATRSKQLVDYLHAAGDSIGYDTVERISTSIAEKELARFKANNNTYIPQSLVPGRFIQFAADNLDLLEETLDGKGTFHVTQMVVFQRGPENEHREKDSTISRNKSLKNIPPEFHELATSVANLHQVSPRLPNDLTADRLMSPVADQEQFVKLDLAWMLSRLEHADHQTVPAWTGFNQMISEVCPEKSILGYLPIIQAPAHEFDTILTVMLRCKKIAEHFQQSHVVVTFDEALYCKAKELVWANPEQLGCVIVRLGGFHLAKNFLGVIGKHMEKSGLSDVWIESGVFNESTALNILSGKSWNRAVRAHKITTEALSRIMLVSFKHWQEREGKNSFNEISPLAAGIFEDDTAIHKESLEDFLTGAQQFTDDLKQYQDHRSKDSTFLFWKQYTDMISILLQFIRSERDGNWLLHISTTQQMLPYMAVYDHVNYFRWGTIYLADMLQLPEVAPEVHSQFLQGNFVVKESQGRFNQVSTDMGLEHINKMCKLAGGIVGITRSQAALNRWMLTCAELSHMADNIRQQSGLTTSKRVSSKDSGQTRIVRDEMDVKKMHHQFVQFNPFGRDSEDLMCISTNDVAPNDIKEHLLTSESRGQQLVKKFVDSRLMENSNVQFRDKINQNKSKTFASLHSVEIPVAAGQTKSLRADRDLFKRLFTASASGRNINIPQLLSHEISSVPLSLAKSDGKLITTDKSALQHILADNHAFTVLPQTDVSTCVIIDGMALVQSIGKPTSLTTFGELADVFCKSVFKHFVGSCRRVDVVFDTYLEVTIKSGTRQRRNLKARKIRRIIDSRSVRLPSTWSNFIGLEDNKVDLMRFLAQEILKQAESLPNDNQVVVAGGFADPELSVSSMFGNLEHLCTSHEEADTRMILHAVDAASNHVTRVVVVSRDTDVLLLLLHHRTASEVWMDAGLKSKPKFLPVHVIREALPETVLRNILSFHALTGCDSTSQFAGHGKKSCWSVYQSVPTLLDALTHDRESAFKDAERFVSLLYNSASPDHGVDALRVEMFYKNIDPKKLPPTQDALVLHLQRTQYQLHVWLAANIAKPNLRLPQDCGWSLSQEGGLKPVLTTKECVPSVCVEILTCGCKSKQCNSRRCTCFKNKMQCAMGCACSKECRNPFQNSEIEESDDEN